MAPPTLEQATVVKQLSSHTYEINLDNEWCIGSVPHGGYVTSCFLRVAQAHFSTTLAAQNQSHPMTVHMEFPRRTEQGPATFTVRDVKLGRQTSTVHITLSQHGKDEVLCYINQSNLSSESGVSFPTGWALTPPACPTPDFARLELHSADENWAEQGAMPFQEFRRASNRVRFFFPRHGQPLTSVGDQWLRFRDGTKFTTESLGYVADMFPMIVESYRDDEDPYRVAPTNGGEEKKKKPMGAKYWYPTVVLNIDVKKPLPVEGVDWLFVRARSKAISNGRLDIEVVIMDEAGELVALSHHVALVLSASRNLAARKKTEASKI